MRLAPLVLAVFSFAPLLGQAAPAAVDTTVISACVYKLSGFARIVNNKADCVHGVEKFVQWNVTGPTGPQGPAGPQGPTGPQGPAGPAGSGGGGLPHTIVVPASGTPQQNGNALANAVAASAVATQANPILIQLDAGQYDASVIYTNGRYGIYLPRYVGLKGAGPLLTTVYNHGSRADVNAEVLILGSFGSGAFNSLADLTLTGGIYGFYTLAPGTYTLTNVYASNFNLQTPSSSTYPMTVRITDSVLPSMAFNNAAPNVVDFTAVGSQIANIVFQSTPAQSTIACFATFNTTKVAYTANCQ